MDRTISVTFIEIFIIENASVKGIVIETRNMYILTPFVNPFSSNSLIVITHPYFTQIKDEYTQEAE